MSTIRKTVDDLDHTLADIFTSPVSLYSLRVTNRGDQSITVKLYNLRAADFIAQDPLATVEVPAQETIINALSNPQFPLGNFTVAVSGKVVVTGTSNSPDDLPVLEFEATQEDDSLSGVAEVAMGDDSVVVDCNVCTEDSIVLATANTADATALHVQSAVPSDGSFEITMKSTATAATKVGYLVINN